MCRLLRDRPGELCSPTGPDRGALARRETTLRSLSHKRNLNYNRNNMDALEKQYTARKLAARQDDLLAMAREALHASDADQTQVRISAMDTALTRFAGSEMHQSTFERQASATITARVTSAGGLQEGVVSTNK